MRALKAIFRPEFLNRIDEIVVFDELSKEEMIKVLDIMLEELNSMLKEKGMELKVSDEVREYIAEKAMAEHLGARPIRRIIAREIENKLSEIIISGVKKETLFADLKDGEIKCE